MSNSRSTFSKFTLKPSALSQHTANFNKILEQVPVPKIDPLELVHPVELKKIDTKLETNVTTENIPKPDEAQQNQQLTSAAPTKEFVFGEKLTDRVINAASSSEGSSNPFLPASSSTGNINANSKEENGEGNKLTTPATLWPAANENEDNTHDNDVNTIFKLNCKLFILEPNKKSWTERGYGILKVIELNENFNCKIMMWTDKCFRLILNTKFFEKMQIDQANKKSIMFNAFDNGTIRMFLVKTSNPNDCDELYETLKKRFNDFSENAIKFSSHDDEKKSSLNNSKSILFTSDCELIKDSNTSPIKSKIRLYSFSSEFAKTNLASKNHQLLLDIFDPSNEETIHLSTFLKLIILKTDKSSCQKKDVLEFEINESSMSCATSNDSVSKKNYTVVLHDKESIAQFLSFYNKEPKFKPNLDDSSNDADENEEDTEENTQTSDYYDEKFRKSDSINESERYLSSEEGKDDSCSQLENNENNTFGVSNQASRKRKNENYEEDEEDSTNNQISFKKQEIETDSQENSAVNITESVENSKVNDKEGKTQVEVMKRTADQSFGDDNEDKSAKKNKASNEEEKDL